MPRFDAVLFDLDGTLLYTLPDMRLALNRALERFGHPPRTLEEVRSFVGNGVRRLVERALPPGAEADADGVYRCYSEWYSLHGQERVEYYPGIRETLAALRARGIRTGVVTNKTHADADAMIRRFFGGDVDVTEGKREGRPTKPDPRALRDAMALLGAGPERTLYVGDSGVDAETAKNAGVACALVSWGYRDRAELARCGALAVADTAEELLNLIDAEGSHAGYPSSQAGRDRPEGSE